MKNLIITTHRYTRVYYENQNKEDEIDGVCSSYVG
jgi:hypothetical protein